MVTTKEVLKVLVCYLLSFNPTTKGCSIHLTHLQSQNIDVDQIVMDHYQSSSTPQPISVLPPSTPMLGIHDAAGDDVNCLPPELSSLCSHGYKVGYFCEQK